VIGWIEGGRLVEVVGGKESSTGVEETRVQAEGGLGGKSGPGVEQVEVAEDGADGFGVVRKARTRIVEPHSGQRTGKAS